MAQLDIIARIPNTEIETDIQNCQMCTSFIWRTSTTEVLWLESVLKMQGTSNKRPLPCGGRFAWLKNPVESTNEPFDMFF